MKTYNIQRTDRSIAVVNARYLKVQEGILVAYVDEPVNANSSNRHTVHIFNKDEWKEAWLVD